MTTDTLRTAANLIRERAEGSMPGPWVFEMDEDSGQQYVTGAREIAEVNEWSAGLRNAEHIASWHPAVALAVADWLDREVAEAEEKANYCNRLIPTDFTADDMPLSQQALAVARAYLNESA